MHKEIEWLNDRMTVNQELLWVILCLNENTMLRRKSNISPIMRMDTWGMDPYTGILSESRMLRNKHKA